MFCTNYNVYPLQKVGPPVQNIEDRPIRYSCFWHDASGLQWCSTCTYFVIIT